MKSGTIQDELNNAAVAVGANMARAVVAAELYRQTGTLPAWAHNQENPPPCRTIQTPTG